MKKIMLLALISVFCLMLFVFMGCGKTNPGGGGTNVNTNINTNANANTNSNITLTITSVTPTLGATSVNSNVNWVITFSSAVDLTTFPSSFEGLVSSGIISVEADHTAGFPILSNANMSWSIGNTVLTLSGILSWGEMDDLDEPPNPEKIVHLYCSGSIVGVNGAALAIGSDFLNYTLGKEYWRYWPTRDGSILEYQVTDSFESPGDKTTYESHTFFSNSGYANYAGDTVEAIQDDGDTDSEINYVRNNSNPFYWVQDTTPNPPTAPGIEMFYYPPVDGYYWDQTVDFGGGPMTLRITTFDDTINVLGNTYPAFRGEASVEASPGVWASVNTSWFVYNIGNVKSCDYNTDGGPIHGLIEWTAEAVSYTPYP